MQAELWTIAAAELVFLLARSDDFLIAIKSPIQRTEVERQRTGAGLVRSLLLEAIIMVPASAALILLLSPWIPFERLPSAPPVEYARASLLGVISYGFPFVTIKKIAVRIALSALREFISLVPKNAALDIDSNASQTSTEQSR